jgi:hypothetical protein
MAQEPHARPYRDVVQHARFFEQVCCAWHQGEFLFASQLLQYFPVQLEDLEIVASDDEQRRRADQCQGGAREVGTASPQDDRSDQIDAHGGRLQGRRGARARPEVTDPQLLDIRALR